MPDIKEYMNIILPKAGPIVIFEIGCHFMEDTEWMRAAYPDAQIFAFDPDPRNISHIKNNRIAESLRANFYPYALSNKTGCQPFYLSSGISDLGVTQKSQESPTACRGVELAFEP